MYFLLLIVLVVIFLTLAVFVFVKEKRSYNRGECPRCNGFLHDTHMDSQSGIRYQCPGCGYFTYTSWPIAKHIPLQKER